MTGFGKIRLNAANNLFQYHRVKPYGSIFFEKFFMAEMDRHQLALAYDAVVSSGVLFFFLSNSRGPKYYSIFSIKK